MAHVDLGDSRLERGISVLGGAMTGSERLERGDGFLSESELGIDLAPVLKRRVEKKVT